MLALRQHQLECLDAIDKHFAAENSRGLVKMFCGAGKSLVIYNALIKHGADLAVVVVPSINLITQFNTDYLIKFAEHSGHDYTTLTICSKDEISTKGIKFTTEPDKILEFLESDEDDDTTHKIILVTYQSLETLFAVVEEYEYTIDLICFDEAHHIVADGVQELLFGPQQDEYSDERYGFIDSNIERSLFFTATPINKNGICMFNLDNHITIGETDYEILDTLDVNECSAEDPHCGDMIYEYMHIDGVNDNVLNDFDIRVDLYTDEGDISIFEAIARTILETGNSRVLTFHSRSEVVSEKSSDVLSFYSESNKRLFKKAFDKVLATEFHSKAEFYKKITLTGITGNTKNRTKILDVFDNCPDDEIYLLGSCETIGEGVDTKSANMCVFVDPKQSYVKIIQNIGRICRKQVIKRNGTVLIPARVDVEKYKDCEDAVARDRVIREEMSKTGDFNGILNCLSALRQEDPYMFELCLKYPDVFTKKELSDNFRKNGLTLNTVEYSGKELFNELGVEYKDSVSEKANFNMLSRKLGTNIQVSRQKILEEDMYIDRGCDKTTHFVKADGDKYMKITTDEKGSTSDSRIINRPHRNAKPFFHANSDIQVLWKFTSDLEIGKSVFGGYIEIASLVYNKEKWYEKLEEVKDYINLNNKRPSKEGKNNIVKNLGGWIGSQIQNYKHNKHNMKNVELREAWKMFMYNSNYSKYFITVEQKWFNYLNIVKNYIDTNNQLPSQHDKDTKIKILGNWIGTQKQNYKKSKEIMNNQKIKDAWLYFITDTKYLKYFSDKIQDWYNNFKMVKSYIDINNKRPCSSSKDKYIQILGSWIYTQMRNLKNSKYIMANPEIKKSWIDFITDPIYLKFFCDKEQEWYNTLDEVKTYINNNSKRPDSSNILLSSWLFRQLKNYDESKQISVNTKSNKCFQLKTNLKIKQSWIDFVSNPKYAKYFTDKYHTWYNTLKSVKTYMDINNKRPNSESDNTDVKYFGNWLLRQTKNYKASTQIMKEQEIRQVWEEFTGDPKYSPYFTTEPKPAPKSTTVKPKIKTIEEPKETETQRQQRKQSEYQELTKKMSTQKSENTNKMFIDTPSLWHNYHDSRDFSFKGYDKPDEIPLNKIIKYLETKKNHKLKILDLGCGRNLIQEHFKDNKKFTVTGYDYVSYNGSKVADISHLPEEDESVKVCVYSQSLMGSNWKEYLLEGYRVLEYNGEMVISESVERYEVVKEQLEAIGMHVIREEYSETQRWFYIYAIKQ